MTKETLALLRMTPAQVNAEWARRQREARANGQPHYTELIVPKTGDVVARIDAA